MWFMKNENGLTLVELLVSIFILGVGILAFLTLQIRSMKARSLSRNITSAVFVVESKVEDLLSSRFSTIGNGTDNKTINEVFYQLQWTVSNPTNSTDLKEITVDAKWDQNKKEHTVSLTTVKNE